VLFEMLTLQRPRDGSSRAVIAFEMGATLPKRLLAVRPDLPVALGSLIQRMLDVDPSARPANCEQLATALEGMWARWQSAPHLAERSTLL
jgi:serine/threonine protein kinase